jgi:hypothetical protein
MDYEEKKLKIYEIFNRRIIEGTKEFYLLISIFLVILTAIFEFSEEKWVGLIIAVIWFFCIITQLMWKRYWQGRANKLENFIFVDEELKKVKETEKNQPKLLFISLHQTFIFAFIPLVFIIFFFIS